MRAGDSALEPSLICLVISFPHGPCSCDLRENWAGSLKISDSIQETAAWGCRGTVVGSVLSADSSESRILVPSCFYKWALWFLGKNLRLPHENMVKLQ